jgi:hypothetical protein
VQGHLLDGANLGPTVLFLVLPNALIGLKSGLPWLPDFKSSLPNMTAKKQNWINLQWCHALNLGNLSLSPLCRWGWGLGNHIRHNNDYASKHIPNRPYI